MVSLETVKLLESKVTQTIDYVNKVTGENSQLKEKLSSYQKRIEDLEVLVQQFKENQSKIEDGILSALDQLNKFEDALESKLSMESKPVESKPIEAKSSAESKIQTENKPVENKPAEPKTVPAAASKNPENTAGKKPQAQTAAPAVPIKPPVEEEQTSEADLEELDIF